MIKLAEQSQPSLLTVQAVFDHIAPRAGGKAVSLIRRKDGEPLVSFRLRAATPNTPTTLLMLVGPAYLEVGWIAKSPRAVVDLHPKWRDRAARELAKTYQFDPDAYDRNRKALYRLWNDRLFQGRMPEAEDIGPREPFERRFLLRFQADHPDWYHHLIAALSNRGKGFEPNALQRIRNCGSVSDKQAAEIIKALAKRNKVKPSPAVDEDEFKPTPEEEERQRRNKAIMDEITRLEDEAEERERNSR